METEIIKDWMNQAEDALFRAFLGCVADRNLLEAEGWLLLMERMGIA